MIQTLPSIVRYSETDESGRLSLPALVDYFQDAAELHGDRLGIGWRYLAEQHLAWLLSSWQIEIGRLPELSEEILVKTWGWKFQSIFGMRNSLLLDKDGNTLVTANSVWFLYDTQAQKPVRVPENVVNAFGIHPRADMKYAPRKLPDMEGGEVMESFSVGRQNLDTNHHVNNAQYVAMAMECLPRGIKPVELLVEYKKQAYLGDIITPVVQRTEDGYAISLRASGGDSYANLRLRTG